MFRFRRCCMPPLTHSRPVPTCCHAHGTRKQRQHGTWQILRRTSPVSTLAPTTAAPTTPAPTNSFDGRKCFWSSRRSALLRRFQGVKVYVAIVECSCSRASQQQSDDLHAHLEVARDPFRSVPRHPSMAVFEKCLRSPRRRCRASEACLPTLLSMMRVGVSAFVSPSSWHLLSGCWGLLTDKIYPLCSAEPSHELAFLIRDSHMLPFNVPP